MQKVATKAINIDLTAKNQSSDKVVTNGFHLVTKCANVTMSQFVTT